MARYFHCAPLAALCRVTRGRHRGVKIEKLRLFCFPAEVLKTFTPSEKLAFFPHGAKRCPLGRERDGAAVHLLPLFSVSSQHFPSFRMWKTGKQTSRPRRGGDGEKMKQTDPGSGTARLRLSGFQIGRLIGASRSSAPSTDICLHKTERGFPLRCARQSRQIQRLVFGSLPWFLRGEMCARLGIKRLLKGTDEDVGGTLTTRGRSDLPMTSRLDELFRCNLTESSSFV